MGVHKLVFRRTASDLSVYLTKKEMTDSFSEEKLFFILRRAMFKTNFFPKEQSFKVKTLLLGSGGMRITFTPILKEKVSFQPLVFRFKDLDSLYASADTINKKYSLFVLKSRLYRFEGYVLIIYPLTRLDYRFYKDMAEFGEFIGCSEIKRAYFDEHGICLEEKNAIEKLCL